MVILIVRTFGIPKRYHKLITFVWLLAVKREGPSLYLGIVVTKIRLS